MYHDYFGLAEAPFSITPDPAFVYLSARHRDALAHLLYGVGKGGSGGFVQLTGEVGTGKTTLCRCLLEQVPEGTQIALVLNPMMTPRELLAAICEELGVDTTGAADSSKLLVDRLNRHLLGAHAAGERVVVVIDEAQDLSPEALEQVRLLTNLETSKQKLLQVVLLGQPELRDLLQRRSLRQLAQRITARYHLTPLSREDTAAYVRHRMQVAGARRNPFGRGALRALYQRSSGVPRLINIIADRALVGAYAREKERVDAALVHDAANEVQLGEPDVRGSRWPAWAAAVVVLAAVGAGLWALRDAGYLGGAGRPPAERALLEAPATRPPAPQLPAVENAVEGEASDAALAATARDRSMETDGEGAETAQAASADGEPVSRAVPEVPADTAPAPAVPAEVAAEVADGGGPASGPPPADALDPDWLAAQSAGAWRGLAAAWGDPADAQAIQSACDGAGGLGWSCLAEDGTWTRIRRLDLPVLLEFPGPLPTYLLLSGLDDGRALVGMPGETRSVPRAALEERWFGRFVVAWPQAPGWPAQVRRGDRGEAVRVIVDLARRAPEPYVGGEVFDANFETWVRGFQARNGLEADGIVGPATLLYLMAPTLEHPRLRAGLAGGA